MFVGSSPPHREEEGGLQTLYGKVVAFITDILEEILLFGSEASGTHQMNIGDVGSFELWRSVIVAPIDGSLILGVETWEEGESAKANNLSRCSTIFIPQICDEIVALPCALT